MCILQYGEIWCDALLVQGSLSGYHHEIDQDLTEAALTRVTAAAKQVRLGLFLGTIFAERTERGRLLYDQQRVYARDGQYLGFNAKQLTTFDVHYPGVGEEQWYIRGKPTVFQLGADAGSMVTAGALICNDMWADPSCSLHDPFLSHVLASQLGARLIFHSVNGGPGNVEVATAFHHGNLQYRAQVTWHT